MPLKQKDTGKMPVIRMANHYNIAVIGAGPGGYVAALKAAQLGASVAIVEKHQLGGTCLNYGCIPSKAFSRRRSSCTTSSTRPTWASNSPARSRSTGTKSRPARTRSSPASARASTPCSKARKVTLYQGRAKLDGPGKVVVAKDAGATDAFTAEKIIVAVGSVPSRIPGWPTDVNVVCTSDEAAALEDTSESLLIVGGGVIGCEFACMMQPLGVEVTVVEMLPQLLPMIDPQIAETLTKTFNARGIKTFTGVKIESLKLEGSIAKATLGNGQTIEADRVLVATGANRTRRISGSSPWASQPIAVSFA